MVKCRGANMQRLERRLDGQKLVPMTKYLVFGITLRNYATHLVPMTKRSRWGTRCQVYLYILLGMWQRDAGTVPTYGSYA